MPLNAPCHCFRPDDEADEVSEALEDALRLSVEPKWRDHLHKLGEGWVAEEALAIAVLCAVAAKDPSGGNHCGCQPRRRYRFYGLHRGQYCGCMAWTFSDPEGMDRAGGASGRDETLARTSRCCWKGGLMRKNCGIATLGTEPAVYRSETNFSAMRSRTPDAGSFMGRRCQCASMPSSSLLPCALGWRFRRAGRHSTSDWCFRWD
jgi:hypothetical protein